MKTTEKTRAAILTRASYQRRPSANIHRNVAESSSLITISFKVHRDHASSLRAAVESLKNDIGTRLESPADFRKEDALTYASIGVSSLLAAVVKEVPKANPDYNL